MSCVLRVLQSVYNFVLFAVLLGVGFRCFVSINVGLYQVGARGTRVF